MNYYNHITPEEWSNMGLEDMSTLRGVAEEIVKSFLDDSLILSSPVIPLKRLEEFFDNKTVICSVRVEFLADNLPPKIEEEINLDEGTVITIERKEVKWRSLPFVYSLKKEIPIRFNSFKKLKEVENKLEKHVHAEISKLLLTLTLMGCEWTVIGGFTYGPPYPFWPRKDMEDLFNLTLWMNLPALIKRKSQAEIATVESNFPEELRKLGVKPVPERDAELLEYGPWHPPTIIVGRGSLEMWIKFKQTWSDISKLPDHVLKPLSVAAKRYFYSINLRDLEDIIINFCIFLEALTTKSSEVGELTEKISRRAALLISKDDNSWFENSREIRAMYNVRSKIVHGKFYDEKKLRIDVDSLRKIMLRMIRNILFLIMLKPPFCDDPLENYDQIVNIIEKAAYLADLRYKLWELWKTLEG